MVKRVLNGLRYRGRTDRCRTDRDQDELGRERGPPVLSVRRVPSFDGGSIARPYESRAAAERAEDQGGDAVPGVDFLGCRLVMRKGHLNAYITPKALERFREEVRRLTRRTAGKSLRAVVSRLNRYVRGWGEYFKRAEVAGLFDRYDRWITRRLRAFVAKRWRNGLWRRYPDQWFWFHLGLTRLYHLRRNFIRELAARRRTGNHPVERSAGNPHATFVRGTEASS